MITGDDRSFAHSNVSDIALLKRAIKSTPEVREYLAGASRFVSDDLARAVREPSIETFEPLFHWENGFVYSGPTLNRLVRGGWWFQLGERHAMAGIMSAIEEIFGQVSWELRDAACSEHERAFIAASMNVEYYGFLYLDELRWYFNKLPGHEHGELKEAFASASKRVLLEDVFFG